MNRYQPLAREQRYQISLLLQMERTQKEIAEKVGVHASTISRELRRNGPARSYCPERAHERATVRRRQAPKARKISEVLWAEVESKLREEWSPEQISDWLRTRRGIRISHTWIYEYVRADRSKGGDLYQHLRFGKKKRRRGKKSSASSHRIPNRVGIEERPDIVEKKERLGDWEGDTIVGKGRKSCLVTLVDRVSKVTRMAKVPRKYADLVRDRIIDLLGDFRDWAHTLTLDNGTEFVEHEGVAKALKMDIYFARPYRSCDRGLNENTNGLIRQYFPKGTDFDEVSDEEIERVEQKLNHRPRKGLGSKTPTEIFFEKVGKKEVQSQELHL